MARSGDETAPAVTDPLRAPTNREDRRRWTPPQGRNTQPSRRASTTPTRSASSPTAAPTSSGWATARSAASPSSPAGAGPTTSSRSRERTAARSRTSSTRSAAGSGFGWTTGPSSSSGPATSPPFPPATTAGSSATSPWSSSTGTGPATTPRPTEVGRAILRDVQTTTLLTIEREGAVATLTLNRPDQRNALSLALMTEVVDALGELRADPETHVVVLAGAGPAFCAGHDLGEMVGRDLATYDEIFALCTRMMNAIHELPQPVIARVHGIATAAGCQLVAACDLAVAASDARFATPGVKIGLFCSTPMVEVSRAVGRKRALELLLTGAPIDAETAADWGLINRVVAPEELDAATQELAHQIAAASPLTIGIGKRAYYEQIDLDLAGAYEHCQDVMSRNATAEDAQEGIGAFLEK